MKEPKYTDLHRYPNGYTPANRTDVSGTWKRFGFDPNAAPQAQGDLTTERQATNPRELPAVAAPLKFRRKA